MSQGLLTGKEKSEMPQAWSLITKFNLQYIAIQKIQAKPQYIVFSVHH
jgi:hypothetical protein